MDLEAIESSLIDDRIKGIPPGIEPFELRHIDRQGWNVLAEHLPLPLAVLKTSALEHNRGWMQRFIALTGVQLYPHGKTTMSPQLFALQLQDGARGISLATIHQLAIARRFGVKRMLLANQLIAPPAIDYVVEQLQQDDELELMCLVDSAETVRRLSTTAKRHGLSRPIDVLLEVGVPGGRCGVRDLSSAIAVARAVTAAGSGLRLRGIEGFEGSVAGATLEETEAAIRNYLSFLWEVAENFCSEGLLDPDTMLFSAGGSAFFDLVVEASQRQGRAGRPEGILRSGCYLTHDNILYQQWHQRMLNRSPQAAELGEGLQGALELWAYVQSRPESTRAVLTLGRRDCSYDIHLPILTQWYRPGEHELPVAIPAGHRIASLNDQHALADVPEDSPLRVGDMVAAGISHPCTTFDKWQLIPLVDDHYQVTGAVRTFF